MRWFTASRPTSLGAEQPSPTAARRSGTAHRSLARQGRALLAVATVLGSVGAVAAWRTSSQAAPTGPVFPTRVSADGRYLVDQNGDPYLMQADSSWCLPNHLTPAQADVFFANRAAQGFNTVLVAWACGWYILAPTNGASYDGLTPFVNGDWSKPTEAYWARFDQYVASAAAHGIELAIDTDTSSFLDQMEAQGPTVMRNFGAFMGARYAKATNVMWIQGNDFFGGGGNDVVLAVAEGIRQAAPNHLQTVQLWPRMSTSNDDPAVPAYTEMTTAYSYYPTYDVVLRAYGGTPGPKPTIMIEANYEGENNTGGPATTDETIRRQAYWSLTSGAVGHFYGNATTYLFGDAAWPTKMYTPAAAQTSMATNLFRTMPWHTLVPDGKFLTAGTGTYTAAEVDVLESDYATATRTPDGAYAVVYVPTARTVAIDATKVKAGSTARWFDPVTGASQAATAPYTTPGRHADGTSDWVLVFSPSTTTATTAAPTTTATTAAPTTAATTAAPTTTATTTATTAAPTTTATTTATTAAPTTATTTATTTASTTATTNASTTVATTPPTTTPPTTAASTTAATIPPTAATTAPTAATTPTTATTVVTTPAPPPVSPNAVTGAGFVQVAAATPQNSTSTVRVPFTSNQTAGNLNVIAIGWTNTSASVKSVVDSRGNVYRVAASLVRKNGVAQTLYVASNVAPGPNTVTVTLSRKVQFLDVRVAEYRGVSKLVTQSSSSGRGGAATTSLFATAPGQLVVAAGTTTNFFSESGSGWTTRIVTSPDADIVLDRVVSSAGSVTATAIGDTGGWVMQAIALS